MSERETDLIDAMVAIIRHPDIDAKIARLAATVVSIDAYFNARVTKLKKLGVERGKMLQILDFAEAVLDESRAIASAVEQGSGGKEAGDRLLALRDRISNHSV